MIFDDDMAELENKRLMQEMADERNYQELHDEWCLLMMEPQDDLTNEAIEGLIDAVKEMGEYD